MENPSESTTQIERYSETYKKRQLKLLGHVITANNTDPMGQVALREGLIEEKKIGKQVGKSKLDWIQEGKKSAWNKFRNEIDQADRRNPNRRRKYKAKLEQDMKILEWAIAKIFRTTMRGEKPSRAGRAGATLPENAGRDCATLVVTAESLTW